MAKNIYKTVKYKEWRKKVFVRDLFKCQLCGTRGLLQGHHIKMKSKFPQYMYNINNGITLCIDCHVIVTKKEVMFEQLFSKIVNKTLSIDYIYKFFNSLDTLHPEIVNQFKKKRRWLLIPPQLIKRIKINKANSKIKKRLK